MKTFCAFCGILLISKVSFPSTEMRDLIADYKMILKLDEKVVKKFQQVFSTTSKFSENITISGSMYEGCFSSRYFFRPYFEADLELTLFTITYEQRHCVKNIPNKTNFATVQCIYEGCNHSNFVPLSWKRRGKKKGWSQQYIIDQFLKIILNSDGFLKPQRLKRIYMNTNIFDKNSEDRARYYIALLTKHDLASITIANMYMKQTKATTAMVLSINIHGKQKYKFSIDFSYNIRINWTPEVYRKWFKRPKRWPTPLSVKDLIKYGYIIGKPGQKHNLTTVEHRYSFAHLERKLVSLHTTNQRLVYLIFKSVFYTRLKPLDSENITSFITKTSFFWLCENYPPDDSFWVKDLFWILGKLFTHMLNCFENGFLPYYFIPEINVIKNIPELSRKEVISTLRVITKNVRKYIPENTKEVSESLENLWRILDRYQELVSSTNTFPDNIHKVLRKFEKMNKRIF